MNRTERSSVSVWVLAVLGLLVDGLGRTAGEVDGEARRGVRRWRTSSGAAATVRTAVRVGGPGREVEGRRRPGGPGRRPTCPGR